MGKNWRKTIIEKKKITKTFKRHKERLLKNEVEELQVNHKFVTGELNPQAPGKRNRKRKRAKELKKENTTKKLPTFGPELPQQKTSKNQKLTLEDNSGDAQGPTKKRKVNPRTETTGSEYQRLNQENRSGEKVTKIKSSEKRENPETEKIRSSTKTNRGNARTSEISKEELKGNIGKIDMMVGMDHSNMKKPQVGPSYPKKALFSVKKHWLIHQDYNWAKSKLNSICKDLEVQHIVDSLTVQVYETYAKIALEMKDLPALHECLLKLFSLYKIGLEGNKFEFVSYAILHELVEKGDIFYESPLLEEKGNECIDHARQVVYAVESGQYKNFFSLYLASPNMSDFLLDLLLGRVRKTAIKVLITKHQKPIDLSVVVSELLFQNKVECMLFLETTKYKYDHTYLYTTVDD